MISIISIARRKENAFLGFSNERLRILCVAIKCLLMPYKCLRLDAFWSCVGENMVLPNVRSNWLMLAHAESFGMLAAQKNMHFIFAGYKNTET